MSIYYCSITGQPAEDPVASKKSGHTFERRVIEKYIDSTQLCPITSQPLTRDDIISIQVDQTTKPRPVNVTGVADVVKIFQSEWDSLMLEAFTLKKNLEEVRQELSQTLYQHDAACRVIARLIRERDEAKAKVEEIGQQGMEAQGSDMGEEAAGSLPQEVINQITEKKAELTAMRRERKKNKEIIDNFASQEMISEYQVSNSLTLHSTTKPGITCLDINLEQDDLLVTGGNDGAVIFYNRSQDKIINTYEKHHKRISDVRFVPNTGKENVLCLLSSEDGIGNLLSNNIETGEITVSYKMNSHRDALVGCAVHPLNYIGLFCCRDGSFSYHDLSQASLLSYVSLEGVRFKTLKIHPDGHIAAFASSDGFIRIWSIMDHKVVAEAKAHNGPVDSLNFSENGVNFATSSYADKTVKLWDLRNFGEDNFKLVSQGSGAAVNFDQFGQFLAVGTNSLMVYNVKDLDQFTKIDAHKDAITSIQFGTYSKYIATVSLDRRLVIYS